MSIKNYLQKKKMAQTGSMLDAFVAEQMYNKIESLVEEEHLDKKKILIETAEGIVQELRDFTDKLEENTKESVDNVRAISVEEIEAKKKDLVERFISDLNDYESKVKARLSEIEKIAKNTLVEIEKKRGEKGDTGATGKDGKDGSPDTALEIATKVNKEKDLIDPSVIKGLTKEIESLKRVIRQREKGGGGGGGGMGQVQHETKNVSSATTTITTDYKIAGNGYAIMGAYYQSALIMRGEHYTVGGDRKTLTLTFVPQDSTKIDVIYVRG